MTYTAVKVAPLQISMSALYVPGVAVVVAVLAVMPKSATLSLGLAAAGWSALTLVLRPTRRLSSPALAILTVAALLLANVPGHPPELLAAGMIATLAGLLPFLATPLRRTPSFPLPHVFGLVSAVYVATGFLLSGEMKVLGTSVSEEGRIAGLLLTGAFLSAMAVVAWLVLRCTPSSRRVEDVSPNVKRSFLVACGAEIGFLALVSIPSADALGQAHTLVRAIAHAAVIVLFVAVRRNAAPRRILVLVIAVVVVEALWGLGTSLLYNAVLLPIELLAADIAIRRRVPWALLLAATLVALVGNSIKEEVRTQGFLAGGFKPATVTAFAYATPHTIANLDVADVSESAQRFSYSQGDLLGYLSDTVPDRLPHWDARTYRLLPFGAVPRALAPWKPRSDNANEFGRRYGLLDLSDRVTSANLPFTAEAYVNFGVSGLLVAGATLGLALGLLARVSATKGIQHIAILAVITGLLARGVESDSSVVVGSVPWILLGLYFATRLLLIRTGATSPRVPGTPGSTGFG